MNWGEPCSWWTWNKSTYNLEWPYSTSTIHSSWAWSNKHCAASHYFWGVRRRGPNPSGPGQCLIRHWSQMDTSALLFSWFEHRLPIYTANKLGLMWICHSQWLYYQYFICVYCTTDSWQPCFVRWVQTVTGTPTTKEPWWQDIIWWLLQPLLYRPGSLPWPWQPRKSCEQGRQHCQFVCSVQCFHEYTHVCI